MAVSKVTVESLRSTAHRRTSLPPPLFPRQNQSTSTAKPELAVDRRSAPPPQRKQDPSFPHQTTVRLRHVEVELICTEGRTVAEMLGAGLSATVGKAMAGFLRRLRRLLRLASPGDMAPWSELPPEMLGLVLSRLPSQVDRVRLRAVCRPWRSAPLPPAFPWIVLLNNNNTFVSLPDGSVHRLPSNLCYELSVLVPTGSTLFIGHTDGRGYLVNPSSGESTPLDTNLTRRSLLHIHKMVLSDHIAAFYTDDHLTIIPRQGGSHMTWAPHGNIISDIAVFQRKLYVLTRKCSNTDPPQHPDLHVLDINDEHNCVTSVQCISATQINDGMAPAIRTPRISFYLVVSGDRLLMVQRQIHMELVPEFKPIRTIIDVWEAVDLIGSQGRWSKVDTLMGHALFVGKECSGSLPPQCGAREDCVYFMTTRYYLYPGPGAETGDFQVVCSVYNLRDMTMEEWEVVAARHRYIPAHPTWLFPDDV